MNETETAEMSYSQQKAESIITGLEDPLNQHLIKLIGFQFAPELRDHFRQEVRGWLRKIQRLRIKPTNRAGSAEFYFGILFDEPFGGVEVRNMRIIMEDIAEQYPGVAPVKSPEETVGLLRDLHTRLAQRLSAGQSALDLVPE
jgi:hypothetical protein